MSFGYDYSCTTLSQEGRIYQLEYAEKAVENSSSVMGVSCKDGVILASEKIRNYKTIVKGSNNTIYSVTPNIGMAICGHLPDGRNIVARAKQESKSYFQNFGMEISGKILAERIALYVQSHTLYWSMRPFGSVAMISSYDANGHHLFMIEGNGNCFEYYNCAQGKGRQFIKAEVEREVYNFRNRTCNDAVEDVMKILCKSYEGEKDTEYDLSVISTETSGKHKVFGFTQVDEMARRIKNAGPGGENDKKMDVDL